MQLFPNKLSCKPLILKGSLEGIPSVLLSLITKQNVTKHPDVHKGRFEARNPTVVEVVVVSAVGRAGAGPLGEVVTGLTGSALVAAAPGAALAGGVAPLTTPAVAPESPGTPRHTHPIGQTRTEAHRGQEM